MGGKKDCQVNRVEPLEYSSETPMGEVTVPTGETVAMTYFMKAFWLSEA